MIMLLVNHDHQYSLDGTSWHSYVSNAELVGRVLSSPVRDPATLDGLLVTIGAVGFVHDYLEEMAANVYGWPNQGEPGVIWPWVSMAPELLEELARFWVQVPAGRCYLVGQDLFRYRSLGLHFAMADYGKTLLDSSLSVSPWRLVYDGQTITLTRTE